GASPSWRAPRDSSRGAAARSDASPTAPAPCPPSASRLLPDLHRSHEHIVSIERRQEESPPAVDKPTAYDVHPEEAADRAHDHARGGARGRPGGEPLLRRQRRVAIRAGQKIGHVAIRAVLEMSLEPRDRAVDGDRLVDGPLGESPAAPAEET